jgi:hypothetical protein
MVFRWMGTILQSHNQYSMLLKLIWKLLERDLIVHSVWEVTFCLVSGQTAGHSVWEVTFCLFRGQTVVHSMCEVTFCLFRGQTAGHIVWEVTFCLFRGQTAVLTDREELHCNSENCNKSSFLARGCHGKDLSCRR